MSIKIMELADRYADWDYTGNSQANRAALEAEVDRMTAERDALRADVDVLLGHMDTMQRCTNDPMMYNLASVVINRFAAMKGKS